MSENISYYTYQISFIKSLLNLLKIYAITGNLESRGSLRSRGKLEKTESLDIGGVIENGRLVVLSPAASRKPRWAI